MPGLFGDYRYSNCLSNSICCPLLVSGCTTPAAPKHGWVRRQGSKLTAGCNSSDDTWQMTCTDGIWQGKMENCTPGNTIMFSVILSYELRAQTGVCLSVCTIWYCMWPEQWNGSVSIVWKCGGLGLDAKPHALDLDLHIIVHGMREMCQRQCVFIILWVWVRFKHAASVILLTLLEQWICTGHSSSFGIQGLLSAPRLPDAQ